MKTSGDSFDNVGDNEALLGDGTTIVTKRSAGLSRCSIILWMITTFLVGLVAGLTMVYFMGRSSYNDCVKQTTQSTPILEDLTISYGTIPFNGSFMQEDIYRRPASPEVDAAWEALGVNYRPLRIPPELAKVAGLRSDHVQIKEKYGGGYPANVEGLHHLHCLNLVRQALVWDYDYYLAKGEGAFSNNDVVIRKHVTHCLDILRQQLMCTVDVAVFGQVWYRASPGDSPAAFVDFNTDHKCRNYDDVRKWAKVRQLPLDPPEDFLEPPKPGQKIVEGVP